MEVYVLAFSLGKSFKRCSHPSEGAERKSSLQLGISPTNVSDSYKRELLLHVLFIKSNQLKVNLMSQRRILDIILLSYRCASSHLVVHLKHTQGVVIYLTHVRLKRIFKSPQSRYSILSILFYFSMNCFIKTPAPDMKFLLSFYLVLAFT